MLFPNVHNRARNPGAAICAVLALITSLTFAGCNGTPSNQAGSGGNGGSAGNGGKANAGGSTHVGGATSAGGQSSGGTTTSSAGGMSAAGGAGGVAGGAGGSPGCVPQDAGATVVADSVYGFSGTQGQCGWSYGYLPDGAEPFTPLTIYVAGCHADHPCWEESTSHPPWLITQDTYQHPNLTPLQWNDRRWTSTVAGTVSLKGQLAKADTGGGDGITGHIRVAGTEVWHATVAYNDTVGETFLLSADVQVGTTIDFLVDPNADIGFDTTTFTVVISK